MALADRSGCGSSIYFITNLGLKEDKNAWKNIYSLQNVFVVLLSKSGIEKR